MSANADSNEATQFEIANPPSDGITKVKFFNKCNKCAVSSWDKTVGIYEIENDICKKLTNYSHDAGVLDLSVNQDDSVIYSVGCDLALKSFDIATNKDNVIGHHSQPIRRVEYDTNLNLVITGSWDKTVKLWDLRDNNPNIKTLGLPEKVFAMSGQSGLKEGYYLVVGIADRHVLIYDLRKTDEIYQNRESSLKHQTRDIACHPNNMQYVLSSIEGRVAVEYFDTNTEIQKKKYAFKCHRQTDPQTQRSSIFPVNTIAFHPIYHTFATGGGDGVVNIWDGENKKRICQFPSFNTSIASVDFNFDGSLLAIAQSYTWEKGQLTNESAPKDTVYFKTVSDNETKPKPKKNKKASKKQ